MIIGIDTRQPTKNKTGIGYILDGILPVLVNMDKENRYKLLGLDYGVDRSLAKVITFPRIVQRGFNFLWKYFHFPPANIILGRIDTFLFTNFSDFPLFSKKRLLMIADISFARYPQFTERKNLAFLKKNVGPSIKRANKIITISEHAKKEIVDYYNVSPKKVEVVYPGCPKDTHAVSDKNEIERAKNIYAITGKYILFVGTIEPRKNIEGLINAYSLLKDKIKEEYKLVVCGGKGWYYDKVFKLVKERGLENKVVFTGYVPSTEMTCIYSGASVLAFPSFYEGFGLPVLEAFTCGVPVVVSHNSSLPEVGGNAVVYCEADKIETIKLGIEKILSDDIFKNDLIEKGYKQLKRFSWEDSAKKISKLLNS